jgi:lipoprotein-anchoring transpeptidase ErfK/SrfK
MGVTHLFLAGTGTGKIAARRSWLPRRPAVIQGHVSDYGSIERRRSGVLWLTGVFALIIAVIASGFSPPEPHRSSTQRIGEAPRKGSRLDASRINDPNTQDQIGAHSEGDAVVRAAILLDRIHFSPGEITSSYNENLGKAIAAFQSASGLPAIGQMDAATWQALNADQDKGRVEPVQGQQNQLQGGQPSNPGAPPPPAGSPAQQRNTPSPGSQQANTPQAGGQSPQQGQDQGNSQTRATPQGQPTASAQPPGSQTAVTPALITYTIAKADIAGPFTRLPQVAGRNAGERLMLREARLPRLNYSSPLELLAEKFHSSSKLLAELNPDKNFKKEGEQIEVPNVLTSPPPPAAKVIADAATRSVTSLDAGGGTLAFYPATVGSTHDPLPVGNWKVVEIRWHPKFKYNPKLFWDSADKHPRATLPAGPKGPVGVVWIGLSKEHYGLHGTPNPSTIGRTESHGCIRLTNWDATELAHTVRPGTPVVLEEGTPSEVKPPSASSR